MNILFKSPSPVEIKLAKLVRDYSGQFSATFVSARRSRGKARKLRKPRITPRNSTICTPLRVHVGDGATPY